MQTQARPSPQIRAGHPFDVEPPHPRAVEMADALRELRGANGSALPGDLRRAGFSTGEIVEYQDAAVKLADGAWTRYVSAAPDLLADMRLKARDAVPDHPPSPKGTRAGQVFHLTWRAYCRARLAHGVDPCDEQREYCLRRLRAFFATTPLGANQVADVVASVETLLRGGRQ